MDEKTISVVIPVYNSRKYITETINSLLSQTYKPNEIILVDDGSTDGTAKIVKAFNGVIYISQENSGPASARNRGAKEATGDYIFFTDSDCVPELNWLENAIKLFDRPDVAVVSGTYGIANENNLLARCIHKEIIYRHKKLMPEFPKVFGSYNFGVRKRVFSQVKGFDESYKCASGEDNDLSYKMLKAGHRIRFSKDVIVKHHHQVSMKKYIAEQFRHGFWRAKMYFDHPSMAKGDNYTFWKDILEIVLASLAVMALIFSFLLNKTWFLLAAPMVAVLFLLEFFFGFIITKNFNEMVFLSFTMLLRSFSRSLGFMFGLPFFFIKYIIKK